MKTEIENKWFYKFQTEIETMIDNSNYTRVGLMLFQEITKGKYIECWDLRNNVNGDYVQIMFVAYRSSGYIAVYTYNDIFRKNYSTY